jgi:AcrR family transcriptional regulator
MGRRKTITDEDLLQAARRLFLEHGHAVSTKQIARAANISEGVLFQRFSSKSELFFAAMVPPPAGEILTLLASQEPATAPGLERLTIALTAYFRELVPVLVTLLSHPDFRFEDFARRHPGSPLVTLRAALAAFTSAQKQRHAIHTAHSGAAALHLWAIAFSAAFAEWMGAHDGRLDPSVLRAASLCLWEGLKPRT